MLLLPISKISGNTSTNLTQLTLQRYVVVATDYAGLSVSVSAAGNLIYLECLAFPSHANDVMYSVQASQSAFPELSKTFVVAGHSQGGGVTWSVAQRQAFEPHEPFRWILGAATTPAIEANFPDFNRAEILTTERMERIGLIEESYGALATALTLLTGVQLTKPGWTENPSVKKFMAMTSNGSKPILGPLLVIHGEADMRLDVEVATAAVEKTAKEFPGAAIKFLRVEGVDHDPAIASTQWV